VVSPLIDWLKLRRRDLRKVKAMRDADAVFLSPGKCGRTWIRAMLSHAFHLSFGTPMDALIAGDNLRRLDQRIPAVLFTHGIGEPSAIQRQLTAKGLHGKRVVALVRDPRDALVSRYHHDQNRSVNYGRRHGGNQLPPPMTIGDFVLGGDRIERLVRRIHEFDQLTKAVPRGTLFQYEAFRREPMLQLAQMLDALGCAVDRDHVEAAVAFAQFDRLKQREAESFYRSEILRPGDPAEPNSFKVRRGQVGGYKDELTAEEIDRLDQRIDALMSPGLGYRSDERAARAAAATA